MHIHPTDSTDPDSKIIDQSVDERASLVFVDMDRTFLTTNLVLESLLRAIRNRTADAIQIILLLLKNPAAGKRRLAQEFSPDSSCLPLRREVIQVLESLKKQRAKLVLVTGADRGWAQAVVNRAGLFEDVIDYESEADASRMRKLAAIEEYCAKQGYSSFDYLGGSREDLPVFRKANQTYIVGTANHLSPSISGKTKLIRLDVSKVARVKSIFNLIRPLQWIKNLLVFVPIVLAHEIGNIDKWQNAIPAFFSFSFAASAVYVINDLFDIESDRHHPRKSRRPFASGDLSVAWGPPIVLVLLVVAFLIAGFLPPVFLGVLTAYLMLTSAYSVWLKQIAILDVLVLSSLYAIRIVAGSAAASIPASEWLMGFSLFFFLSLAFAKRYAELKRLVAEDARDVKGRGYEVTDWSLIESIGPASGYLAVLVFALYIHSEERSQLYANGWALWLVCPLLLYWITRIWLKANRQQLTEDPIVFAVKDRVSWLTGALIMVLALISQTV